MYRIALEHAGFVVNAAADGASGVASAVSNRPDAIVLDVRLPDMTGWQVCDALKSDARTADIPVIILTAADSPALAQQAARAGCAAHLLKPCFPEELMKTVRAVLAAI